MPRSVAHRRGEAQRALQVPWGSPAGTPGALNVAPVRCGVKGKLPGNFRRRAGGCRTAAMWRLTLRGRSRSPRNSSKIIFLVEDRTPVGDHATPDGLRPASDTALLRSQPRARSDLRRPDRRKESVTQFMPSDSDESAHTLEAAEVSHATRAVVVVRVLDEPDALGDVALVMAQPVSTSTGSTTTGLGCSGRGRHGGDHVRVSCRRSAPGIAWAECDRSTTGGGSLRRRSPRFRPRPARSSSSTTRRLIARSAICAGKRRPWWA
jgi:hypothetical protein